MADVLILGGTGFLGPPIVSELQQANHTVTILSRGTVKPSLSRSVNVLQGDRRDAGSLSRAVKGRSFEVVIDNLAFVPADVRSAINIFAGKTKQYILTSSVVVYGRQSAKPISEDDVSLGEVPEGATAPTFGASTTVGKRQCELVLQEEASTKSLPFEYTVFRPAKIHGRNDPSPRLWWYIQRIEDGGPLVIPADSSDPLIRHIYCDDLAVAYPKVIRNPDCKNETYNLASTEIVSLSELIDAVGSALGKRARMVSVPPDVLEAEGLMAHAHPLLPTGNLIPDISKAEQHFGWKSTPLPQWIKALCDWYRGAVVEDSWGYGLRHRELQVASRFG